jgi:hypothetical protein
MIRATRLRRCAPALLPAAAIDTALCRPAGPLPGRPPAAAAGRAGRRAAPLAVHEPKAARRCCTRWRTSSSTPSIWRWTRSGAFPACPRPTTATGCAWPPRRRCTSRWSPSTWRRSAMPTATSTRTTACGRWRRRPRHDLTARMALVPRTLEARGLDATPPMQKRLAQAGDARAVEILDLILRDEIGHVADRQPLVPLVLRAAGPGPAGALRAARRPPRRAAPEAAVQPGRAPRRRLRRRGTWLLPAAAP